MSNIYLIRHGFTPANNARYNNQANLSRIADDRNMPLEIEYGRKQALELGEFLNTIKGKTLILVSPYRRARETLDIALSKMTGDYDIKVFDELHEIKSGIHYARTVNEVLNEYPYAKSYYIDKEKDKYAAKYINGESEYDVRDRVEEIAHYIKSISDKNEYDNIFVFAHGSVNRWLCFWLTGEVMDINPLNCEVFLFKNNKIESVFTPETFVPKGYVVDIEKHRNL